MDDEQLTTGEDKHETGAEHPQREEPRVMHLSGMYRNWFLDYASYVILERAVPNVLDGLKPVQRRILHSMKELDDGRFNKAANIIGNTMKYHPHGDASIGDALVQLGQKELLVETQGNWGNIYTGDNAAAPRYIEARLSKFALEVVFNPKTTTWLQSYDGRNKEPLALPVKFPLLLAQGVEGIAVGLTSKLLPHNFNELILACIAHLKGEDFELYPDFPTAGMADCSRYIDGARGSRVRVRARINQIDKKTLAITEIAYGTNTGSLIESIINANDRGKIRIRKIEDNTAGSVEILIHLAPGVSPDTTIDALYAFTDCEVSISPVCCVIDNRKPCFTNVKEILRLSVQKTLDLLKLELDIQKGECLEQLHFASLERIFIEKEVYLRMRECKTDKDINETIDKGLKPYRELFIRDVTPDDIHRLRRIPIDRISKYNSARADDIIASLNDDIRQIDHDLNHLVDFAIAYYERILDKFGKNRQRKTELRNFDVIQANMVAAATQKLYVNREEGFAGTSLKKDEFVCDCSDIDDIIVFRADGTFVVTKVSDKVFVGKNVVHIAVFKKNDERTIYNLIYQDGKKGVAMVKRFAVTGITRDKEYCLTKGSPDSKVLYFTANPNGEAETVSVYLRPRPRLKILTFEFDFSTLAIKGRQSIGNILSKNFVRKISLKDEGISTLGARDIWFDDSVNRLNAEQRGRHLGAFDPEDRIVTFMRSGHFRVYPADLSLHFDEDLMIIGKFDPEKIYTAIYLDGALGLQFVKRFAAEASDKKMCFISESPGSELLYLFDHPSPVVELEPELKSARSKPAEQVMLESFIGVKSFRAKGKRLSAGNIMNIKVMELCNEEDLAPPAGNNADPAGDDKVQTDPDESGNHPEKLQKPPVELKNFEVIETLPDVSDPPSENEPPADDAKKNGRGGDTIQFELEF